MPARFFAVRFLVVIWNPGEQLPIRQGLFFNRFVGIKANGVWASNMENRDCLFVDNEENSVTLHN